MLLYPQHLHALSGKMGHLEVSCLELQLPPGAMHFVRTMAHVFTAHGSISLTPEGETNCPERPKTQGTKR